MYKFYKNQENYEIKLCWDTITMSATYGCVIRLQSGANDGLMLCYKLWTSETYCCNASIVDSECYIFYMIIFLTLNCSEPSENCF